MFHADLNLDDLARTFAQDGRIRIKNILQESLAESLSDLLDRDLGYMSFIHENGQNRTISPAEMRSMSAAEQQKISENMLRDARQGIGFAYDGHQIVESQNQQLRSFLDFLNEPDSIEFIRKLTGAQDVSYADGQATRYLPGHYLTRHRDVIEGENRRFAYVFSFAKSWHPDWGGLLQFYQDDGTPRDAWTPEFNTLSLFEVRHVHAVTYVAPFAGAKRLSITGWFRAS